MTGDLSFTVTAPGRGVDANVTVASGQNFTQTGAGTFSTGTGNLSFNGNIVTNIAQTGATTFSTGTGAISLNGDVTLASGKNFTQSGAGTFSTGTGNISLNGNIVTNIAQTGATTFSTGTGAVSRTGRRSGRGQHPLGAWRATR